MRDDEFIEEVERRTGAASPEEARRIVEATLGTLGDRLGGGESRALASQLPRSLGDVLQAHVSEAAERFDLEGFFERVAERAGLDPARGEPATRAVIEVLEQAVSAGEIDDVRAALPAELHVLFRATYPPSAHPPAG